MKAGLRHEIKSEMANISCLSYTKEKKNIYILADLAVKKGKKER